jgi:group I intron endonuclease
MNGIYVIFNLVSGNRYIGSSLDIEKRLYQHKWMLRNGRHDNSRLQRSWDVHGESAFVFAPIEENVSEEDLIATEQFYMDIIPKESLYNSCEFASRPPDGTGRKMSEENKRKIIEANRNRVYKPHTERTKAKIGQSHSRHYPSFINMNTGEVIPSGINLAKICREKKLHVGHMNAVMKGQEYRYKEWTLEDPAKRKVNGHSQQYPDLININTGEIIPSGWNLRQLCRERGLNRDTLKNVINGKYKQNKGWTVLKGD